MEIKLEPSWKAQLRQEFTKDYFDNLTAFVRDEYKRSVCFPPGNQIFSAFEHCPFAKVNVVILGQDPYHGPGQANGLCFSVADGVRMPPSLQNIFKEIADDLGKPIPLSGNLERWASQGVLLLNATLTVRNGEPGSHQNRGWEEFTDAAVRALNDDREGLVFMLWGAYAQKKGAILDQKKHLVLQSPHPSPFSVARGFSGNRHFSRCNEYLSANGRTAINW